MGKIAYLNVQTAEFLIDDQIFQAAIGFHQTFLQSSVFFLNPEP